VWLLVVMNRITCFNPGGISFRSVDCLFKGDRRVNRVSVYTSDSSSFSPWGCFFLLRLPRSTSIIQGYKCFLIHIRVCHRSWIININDFFVLCRSIGRFQQPREWILNDGLFWGFISVRFSWKKTPIPNPRAFDLIMGKLGMSRFF